MWYLCVGIYIFVCRAREYMPEDTRELRWWALLGGCEDRVALETQVHKFSTLSPTRGSKVVVGENSITGFCLLML